jgi:hypothetical protein
MINTKLTYDYTCDAGPLRDHRALGVADPLYATLYALVQAKIALLDVIVATCQDTRKDAIKELLDDEANISFDALDALAQTIEARRSLDWMVDRGL